MQQLKKLYRLINILSFDVAIGAVICSTFFADFFGVTAPINGIAALFITVWLIYTCDHLLDAYKINGAPVTFRHRYHRRNFRMLTRIAAMAALADLILVFTLPSRMVVAGAILAVFVILYLLFINRVAIVKEPMAAAMYCLGILIPVGTGFPFEPMDALLIVQFFLVVLINLLVFSWFDATKDRLQGTHSAVLIMGRSRAVGLIWSLFILSTAILVLEHTSFHFILLWCIGLGNIILFSFHRRFRVYESFRVIGDALFFLPVLSFL